MKTYLLGEPVLREMAEPVLDFTCQQTQHFIEQLLSHMLEAKGVGIAAPQVGVSKQIMIIASKPNNRYPNAPLMTPLVLINPKIKFQSDNIVKDWEGCLSVPGVRGLVPRPDKVSFSYMNTSGTENELTLEGFVARIFLHEFDHLIGLSYLDQVESNKDIVSEAYFIDTIVPSLTSTE